MANHQPVEQLADGSEMLFDGRLLITGLQAFDVISNVQRLDIDEPNLVTVAPGDDGVQIGPRGVSVADSGGEVFQKSTRVLNSPGRSLHVRLHGPDYAPGAAGKWTDAATGDHGDLLDLIARNRELRRMASIMDEARSFLSLPRVMPLPSDHQGREPPAPAGSPKAARRLFRSGRPLTGAQAEAYLRARGISGSLDWLALRFHPSAYYRAGADATLEQWPALLAAITDLSGSITGIQRTWLDHNRPMKAPIADPRRAMGHLLGNGVRFGAVRHSCSRRRHRDDAVRQIRPALAACHRRPVGQSSCRA
jgi:hypothetical protein